MQKSFCLLLLLFNFAPSIYAEKFTLTGDDRPVAGVSLIVTTPNTDDLSQYTFKWIRGDAFGTFDDATILSSTKDYVISESDYEHWLRVTVCDRAGETVFSKDTWISKLPVLYIDTENGKLINSSTNYVTASLRIQGNAEYEQQYTGTTEIRLRGASSSTYPQKPYKLKLDKKTNLFGFGKSKHWVLVSNYKDKSCLRNYIGSELAEELGILHMKMTWVDVVINGEAKGCYMLSQHIRVEKNSVDIFDWEGEAEDIADALFDSIKTESNLSETDREQLGKTMKQDLAWITTGMVTFIGKTHNLADYALKKEYDISKGYLFECTYKTDGYTQFTTPKDVHFEVTSPEYLSTNREMLSFATGFWSDFEAEYSHVPTPDNVKNFSKYADMKSMVGIWLVNEIMGQCDGTNSRFSYIGEDRKLHFGPAWDFDHASSCWVSPGTKEFFYSFGYEWACWYYRKWYPDPVLCQMTYDAYWNIARPFIMECVSENGEINAKYTLFAEAGRTNDILWGSYPSTQNPSAVQCTTAEDVEVLRNFLLDHIKWLDKQFSSVKTLVGAMNRQCTYPCNPDIVDGIQAPPASEQGEGPALSKETGAQKVIKNRHLYIIKDNETYAVDGKRIK